MTSPKAVTREFTGRHMLLLVFAFFGVVIAVNVGMATVATTSWTGLVVQNSYVASQEFETRRLAHEAQKAAGWTATFAFEGDRASLRVTDREGRPIDLGGVQLHVNRPVGGHDDQSVALARSEDGTYGAALVLDAGVWDGQVVASDTPLGPFQLHERFNVSGAVR